MNARGGGMNVLVVDDDPVQGSLFQTALGRWGYQVHTAANGKEALALLDGDETFELLIVDWMMPQMDGLELCRVLRQRPDGPYFYVILLTSRDRRDDIIEGLDAGADDYLIKPIHLGELRARVKAARRILALQAELLAAQERLRLLATQDPLTGIWNRRAIFETLERELERSARQGGALALVMIDLDHFKRVNDTHGHLVGDEVLRESAARIQASIRTYDSLGRYGGEEFLVIVSDRQGVDPFDLAERIRRGFESAPLVIGELSVPLTLSLGVVSAPPGPGARISALISAADAALYEAKNRGRNRTVRGNV